MKHIILLPLIIICCSGCYTTKYNRCDFSGKSFIANDYYGAYPYQIIINFTDSTYSYSSRGGVINGYGTWSISDNNKMLLLKGKEFKSIYPQSIFDQNLTFSIKNKNILIDGKTKYRCNLN
jgi:hypothetical protein